MKPGSALIFDIWELVTDTLGDEIDRDDPGKAEPLNSFKALSLTCKAMVPLCQKHIFSTLLLNSNAGRSHRLRSIISENPGLILYVKNLEYVTFDRHRADDQTILEVLRDKSLILESVYLQSSHKWDRLPDPLPTLFTQLVHMPTVTKLTLAGLKRIPTHVLHGCRNLNHLALREVEFTHTIDDLEHARSSVPPRPVQLEAWGNCYNAIRYLMQPRGPNNDQFTIDFSALKTLTMIYGTSEDQTVVWELVKHTREAETLNLLTFNRLSEFAGLGAALSTHTTPTLRRLCGYRQIFRSDDDPLCGLVAELTQIAGSNVLREISLTIAFMETVQCGADTDTWAAFDSLVTTRGSFPMLKSVSLDISWFTSEGEESEEVVLSRITANEFPALLKEVNVEFRFSAQNTYL